MSLNEVPMYYNDAKPDKATRNKIYRSALVYLETKKIGLCEALTDCDANQDKYDAYRMSESPNFPEIAKHRPVDVHYFWFPLDDKNSRMKILLQAILETDD